MSTNNKEEEEKKRSVNGKYISTKYPQKKKKNHGSLHPWMLSMCKWSEFMAIHKRNSEFVKNLKYNNNINYIKFYH